MESEISQILYWISQYGYFVLPLLFVALGPAVGLLCGYLVSAGTLSFVPVFTLYVLNMFCRDAVLYWIGGVSGSFLHRCWLGRKASGWVQSSLEVGIPTFAQASPMRFFWTLFLAKGVPGVSIAVIVGLGIWKLAARRVLLALAFTQILWSLIIIALGYLWGNAVENAGDLLAVVAVTAAFAAVILQGYYYMRRYMHKRIVRKRNESKKILFLGSRR